jgi:hypothetical protein
LSRSRVERSLSDNRRVRLDMRRRLDWSLSARTSGFDVSGGDGLRLSRWSFVEVTRLSDQPFDRAVFPQKHNNYTIN